jgi:predicted RNA binding protein YcfA (HicA-like mRNA interferase family)
VSKKEKLIQKLGRGSISASDARLLLKHFGFQLIHTRGSHEFYKNNSNDIFVLATHSKEIKKYLIRDLQKLLLGERNG